MNSNERLEDFFLCAALKLGKPNFPTKVPRPGGKGALKIPESIPQMEYIQKFFELAQEMGVSGVLFKNEQLVNDYERWYRSNAPRG